MGRRREESAAPQRSVAKRVLGFVVIIALIVGWKMWNKSDSNVEAADAIRSWVVTASEYEGNEDYVLYLLATHHESAFSSSYTTRRRGSTFDADKYADQVFRGMISQARSAEKIAIADSLAAVYAEYQQQKD